MLLKTKFKTNIQTFNNLWVFSFLRCIQSEFPWVHYSSSKFLVHQILKLGWVVQKVINANLGLKVNQSFSSIDLYKIFLTAYILNISRLIKLRLKSNQYAITENLTKKLKTKLLWTTCPGVYDQLCQFLRGWDGTNLLGQDYMYRLYCTVYIVSHKEKFLETICSNNFFIDQGCNVWSRWLDTSLGLFLCVYGPQLCFCHAKNEHGQYGSWPHTWLITHM